LHHGISIEAAAQIFYVRNVYGVNVAPAIAITRDSYDSLTAAAKDLAPLLDERILTEQISRRVNLLTIRQAICWSIHRKFSYPTTRIPATFDADLARACAWLRTRLVDLRPRFELDPTLRNRPALFLACTDARVLLSEIDVRVISDPFWTSVRFTGAGVELIVQHLIQPRLAYDDDGTVDDAVAPPDVTEAHA
jgi:hypothetical protein